MEEQYAMSCDDGNYCGAKVFGAVLSIIVLAACAALFFVLYDPKPAAQHRRTQSIQMGA